MREFFRLLWTSRTCFLATLAVVTVLFFFFWQAINPDSFTGAYNGFVFKVKQLVYYLFVMAFVFLGLALMTRPLWKKGK